jgi:hypothetical protein
LDQIGRGANDPGVSAPLQSVQEAQSAATAGIQDQGSDPGLDSAAAWGITGSLGSKGSTPSWDTVPDPGVSSANGNHSAAHGSRGPFDAAFTSIPDSAKHTESAQTEEFSWLKNGEQESPVTESEPVWPERAEAGLGWLDRPDTGPTSRPEAQPGPAESASPDPVTERLSRYQASGLTSAERTDFWGQPLSSAAADLQVPAAAPRTEEPPIPRASWPAADTTATAAAEPAHRTTAAEPAHRVPAAEPAHRVPAAEPAHRVPAAEPAHRVPAAEPAHRVPAEAAFGTATTAQSRTPAGSAAQATVTKPDERRQDRLFPARLLVVIVIAALIGSALVLLLK